MPSIQDFVRYAPVTSRPPVQWPGGKRLACWIVPNVEFYEYTPPPARGRETWDRVPSHPDVREYGFRDYGNRIGIWRMSALLEQYPVRPTVSLNLALLDHFPEIAQLIRDKGLQSRVRMQLCDYRDLAVQQPFDKIASVGMIEHVGQANLHAYFRKIVGLLAPGGLVLNHGITAAGPQAGQLGAGIGDFIEKYIFPGGELLHVSQLLREGAVAGLEMLDTENLRPHYARTLWAWSDGLEGQLGQALVALRSNGITQAQAERVLRAYRLYLAGSAMSFERGWLSLHQMLAARPAHGKDFGNPPGAASRSLQARAAG